MITGVHAVLFSKEAEALRALLRDALGFGSVDAGGGWPIYALPPAELAVHPAEAASHELYLMCDDLDATLAELAGKGVTLARPVEDQRWGRLAALQLPGGEELALYQPSHPTAIGGRA